MIVRTPFNNFAISFAILASFSMSISCSKEGDKKDPAQVSKTPAPKTSPKPVLNPEEAKILEGASTEVKALLTGGDKRFMAYLAQLPTLKKEAATWDELEQHKLIKGLKKLTRQSELTPDPANDEVEIYTLADNGFPTLVTRQEGSAAPVREVLKVTYAEGSGADVKPSRIERSSYDNGGTKTTTVVENFWQTPVKFPIFASFTEKRSRATADETEVDTATCSSETECTNLNSTTSTGSPTTVNITINNKFYNAKLIFDIQDKITAKIASDLELTTERNFSEGKFTGTKTVVKGTFSNVDTSTTPPTTTTTPYESTEICVLAEKGVSTCVDEVKVGGDLSSKTTEKKQSVLVFAGGATASVEDYVIESEKVSESSDTTTTPPSSTKETEKTLTAYNGSWQVTKKVTTITEVVNSGGETTTTYDRQQDLTYDAQGRPLTQTDKSGANVTSLLKYEY